MPAYFDTGFCVREPSWHGQETLLDDYPADWAEARTLAGLQWEPRIVPLYRGAEFAPVVGEGDEITLVPTSYEPIVNSHLVERDDTGAPLGVVSSQFSLITHDQMGEIVDAVTGLTNVKYETAGSVKGGETVWALVRLDEPYSTPGDIGPDGEPVQTYPFMALLNSHNGAGAMKLVLTQVRVVCWNTVQAADADGNHHGRQFSFRHVGKPMERIEDAKAALMGLRSEATRWTEMAAELYAMPIDDEFINHYLSEFIPEPPAGIISERVRQHVATDRANFRQLLNGPTNERQAHTALGVFNASVEWCDHVRGYRNADTYLNRTMLRPEPMKAKALGMIRDLCGVVNS